MTSNARISAGYLDLAMLHRNAAQTLPLYSVERARHIRQAEYLESIGAAWAPLTTRPDMLRREALL